MLAFLLILAMVLAWPEPASGKAYGDATPTAYATFTPSPIPQEFLDSSDQTSGIICGSVVLVLVVVGGTLGVLRRKEPGK